MIAYSFHCEQARVTIIADNLIEARKKLEMHLVKSRRLDLKFAVTGQTQVVDGVLYSSVSPNPQL